MQRNFLIFEIPHFQLRNSDHFKMFLIITSALLRLTTNRL